MSESEAFDFEDEEPAEVGVVTVGGKKYAVGLTWQSAMDKAAATREAIAAVKDGTEDADFFCVRSSITTQYGLGRKVSGHVRGMPSLAAALTESEQGSVLGVFELPEGGYYLFACQDDDLIKPGWDRVVDTEEDALREFHGQYEPEQWDHIYAPEEFGFDRAEDRRLEILVSAKTSAKLQPISTLSRIMPTLIVSVVGLAIIGGGYVGMEMMKEPPPPPKPKLTKKIKLPPRLPDKPLNYPWELKSQFVPGVMRCVAMMREHDLTVAGWKPKQFSCDGSKVEVLYQQGVGTINWVAASLNTDTFRPAVVPQGASNVIVSWSDGPAVVWDKDVELSDMNDVRRYLFSQFSENRQQVSLGKVDREPWFGSVPISFKTTLSPLAYLDIFRPIQGITLDKVTYNYMSGQWSVELDAYQHLKPTKKKRR